MNRLLHARPTALFIHPLAPVKKVEKHLNQQINIEHRQECAYILAFDRKDLQPNNITAGPPTGLGLIKTYNDIRRTSNRTISQPVIQLESAMGK